MTDDKVEGLKECAAEAAQNAYAPYSGYRVGAALLSADGGLYRGGNVENASYGASVCAERSALFTAVADGKRDFEAIYIKSLGEAMPVPCGICLQALSEFAPNLTVFAENGEGERAEFKLSQLMPMRFDLK